MAVIRRPCQFCAEEVEEHIGQQAELAQVRWWRGVDCRGCGARLASDGAGELPPGWREAILAQEGEWQLALEPRSAISALRVLRAALGLTLEETGALKAKLPGVIATGTRAEMERLRLALATVDEQGVVSHREPRR